jgi:hypothetical protein
VLKIRSFGLRYDDLKNASITQAGNIKRIFVVLKICSFGYRYQAQDLSGLVSV